MKHLISKTNNFQQLLWLLFVLLVIAVKFFQIAYRSLSLDELYGVVAAQETSFSSFLHNWVLYDTNPPLYYLFLRTWLKLAPNTEFWVRLPSVIFVLLATYFFVVGIKKRFENNTWRYLLLLMGASFGLLFFAQEARAYALLFLWVCLQLLSFIDLLNTKPIQNNLKPILSFTLFTILASYTHYTAVIFSVMQFVILIVVHFQNKLLIKQILIAFIVCCIAGLPWLVYFVFLLNIDQSFILHQDFSILKEILSMLFFGYSPIGKGLSILFIIVVFYLTINIWRMRSSLSFQLKMMLILGFFSGIIILFSPYWPYFFQYRHYMILIPILLLSIAILINAFEPSARLINIMLVSGLLIIVSQACTFYKSNREEWRQAVKYIVDTNHNKNTKVIILGEPWQKVTRSIYLQILVI